MISPPTRITLFPYPTLFRSALVEPELRIVLADLVDHEADRVGQAVRDVQVLQGAETSADQEASEVAFPSIRWDDAVPEQEDQGPCMVAHRVQGLQGRHLRDQLFDGDPDSFRRLTPDLADVPEVFDFQHACDLRVLP